MTVIPKIDKNGLTYKCPTCGQAMVMDSFCKYLICLSRSCRNFISVGNINEFIRRHNSFIDYSSNEDYTTVMLKEIREQMMMTLNQNTNYEGPLDETFLNIQKTLNKLLGEKKIINYQMTKNMWTSTFDVRIQLEASNTITFNIPYYDSLI